MQIHAASIGEAVPAESFDAVVHSAFESAVNMRLSKEDRLISANDAILFRARPGQSLSTGLWSIEAVSDAVDADDWVLVHDAARALTPPAVFAKPPSITNSQ